MLVGLDGPLARVDLFWHAQRTVGEVDGLLKYDDDQPGAPLVAEKLRQEVVEEAGYVVVRMTWAQIHGEPRRTAQRVRIAFAPATAMYGLVPAAPSPPVQQPNRDEPGMNLLYRR